MLINTFWKIFLKIIGLWILFGAFSVIPQLSTTVSFMDGNLNVTALIEIWGLLLLSLFLYFIVVRFFIFKTDWIIDRLKLDKNFKEEKIAINYNAETILSIAIIVMGGLILAEALPSFISRLYTFLIQKEQFKDYTAAPWLIYYFFKLILGYILLTNGKTFSEYIERKSQ
ncbi:hypothetical protein ACFSJW_00305 [Flavobacterium artemisiae]|uniref:DUF2975 domain-containing protein n=1 Tax=Flavobacterium artemisiae TaxID=2126556 RepID=A0ABW4HHY3_9FLAO